MSCINLRPLESQRGVIEWSLTVSEREDPRLFFSILHIGEIRRTTVIYDVLPVITRVALGQSKIALPECRSPHIDSYTDRYADRSEDCYRDRYAACNLQTHVRNPGGQL